jgi:hypothetical protein
MWVVYSPEILSAFVIHWFWHLSHKKICAAGYAESSPVVSSSVLTSEWDLIGKTNKKNSQLDLFELAWTSFGVCHRIQPQKQQWMHHAAGHLPSVHRLDMDVIRGLHILLENTSSFPRGPAQVVTYVSVSAWHLVRCKNAKKHLSCCVFISMNILVTFCVFGKTCPFKLMTCIEWSFHGRRHQVLQTAFWKLDTCLSAVLNTPSLKFVEFWITSPIALLLPRILGYNSVKLGKLHISFLFCFTNLY